MSDPFGFTGKLLEKKKSGSLESLIHEVEEHLQKVHTGQRREGDLGEWSHLIEVDEPEEAFDDSEPKLKKVN